jgi:outer membrane protein TolC
MVYLKRKIGIILLSVLVPGIIMAQEIKKDTLKLSLQQCIDIAFDESPTIKVAEKEIIRTDYAAKEKMAALFPNISAGGQYSRSIKKQKLFFMGNPIEIGTDNSFTGALSASVPIVSPTLWASLKMNALDAGLALESARSSKINLLNSVTKAYYAILLTQDSYQVFEKSYKSAEDNAKIIYNKYKQGTVSEFEWIRADVQLRNAVTNLVSAESTINMSKLQLKMLMGVDMLTEIDVIGNLTDFENKVFADALKLSDKTLDKNTDLNQFDIRANQMKQALEVQKTTWLPSLAASFSYQYMAMANDSVKMSNYKWFPTSAAQLQLSIPLFQGGAKHYKAKQLQVQLSELEDQRESLKRSLELQAITYSDNMIKAIEKLESGKKALSQAEKGWAISKKMYEIGTGTFLDVNSAELGYIQAGLSYNQSIYDFLSAKADLEKILGNSVINY